jgi:protein TonB
MEPRPRLTSVSALVHLVVLGAVLFRAPIHVVPIRLPGTALGTRISLTYAPGRAPAQTSLAAAKPAPSPLPQTTKSSSKPHPQTTVSTNSSMTATANPNSAQGGDALGLGNVTVALATFFPTPHPDLTQLPYGTRGDVVVDVVIDERGKIVDTKMAQGLGHGIDEAVLATIGTWTFKPATKDGIAVPSQQELLFHYERV